MPAYGVIDERVEPSRCLVFVAFGINALGSGVFLFF